MRAVLQPKSRQAEVICHTTWTVKPASRSIIRGNAIKCKSCKVCDRTSYYFFLYFNAPSAERTGHMGDPSRQHCRPAHPTDGRVGNTRTSNNSSRTSISGSQRAGSRSPDLNYERYQDQEPARRCTNRTPRGSMFPPRDSPPRFSPQLPPWN
ncbi:hypothetical protein EVAR_19317_1 [Eumeta japonica]|uniref:Uncharacterized protein n=1 Tax=Eumeta variegata TaxID=151549 RepID=A0A4C1UDB8_EUMVA|nr:hypothetical protein EVAR_19317_1 [Eumeta japonica]